ncbi:MAG: TetR family transcriptional regulator C-terminal domain-containing protein [bacterium]
MGRKSRSEERKPEILKSLYEVLSREGLEGTTLSKVADRMGVNSGLLVHYFRTKEEMILAMVDYMLEKYAAIYISKINEFTRPQDRLDNILETFFELDWTNRGDASVFWSCFSLSFRNNKVKERFNAMYAGFREILAREISLYIDDGIARVTDPVKTADIIITMIEGLNLYRSVKEGDEKLMETAAFFKQTVSDLIKKGA